MISIVHMYAKEYGWTREYVLDCVYVDEHILQFEIIEDNKRQDWLMQAHIALLPDSEEKARDAFLKSLQKVEKYEAVKEIQNTDFEAIKRAKEQLAHM